MTLRYKAGRQISQPGSMTKLALRRARARRIVTYLKRVYPNPKSELVYKTPFQFLVAVVMSAQCTDKVVNRVTASLFKKYKTASDFADANSKVFEKEISSVTFFRNKARHIIESAKKVASEYNGKVPATEKELVTLPGVGYKTAHVILNELYGISEGIPTDTHVKRFAKRFDLVDSNDLQKISKELEVLIPKRDWKYINNGLVLYGRYVCKAQKHDCSSHPLTKLWTQAGSRWPKAK